VYRLFEDCSYGELFRSPGKNCPFIPEIGVRIGPDSAIIGLFAGGKIFLCKVLSNLF